MRAIHLLGEGGKKRRCFAPCVQMSVASWLGETAELCVPSLLVAPQAGTARLESHIVNLKLRHLIQVVELPAEILEQQESVDVEACPMQLGTIVKRHTRGNDTPGIEVATQCAVFHIHFRIAVVENAPAEVVIRPLADAGVQSEQFRLAVVAARYRHIHPKDVIPPALGRDAVLHAFLDFGVADGAEVNTVALHIEFHTRRGGSLLALLRLRAQFALLHDIPQQTQHGHEHSGGGQPVFPKPLHTLLQCMCEGIRVHARTL